VGQYIGDPSATSTVLTLPGSAASTSDWDVRVRSEITGEQLSTPFPLSAVRHAPPAHLLSRAQAKQARPAQAGD
jgi:hypothetical protein